MSNCVKCYIIDSSASDIQVKVPRNTPWRRRKGLEVLLYFYLIWTPSGSGQFCPTPFVGLPGKSHGKYCIGRRVGLWAFSMGIGEKKNIFQTGFRIANLSARSRSLYTHNILVRSYIQSSLRNITKKSRSWSPETHLLY